MPHTLVHGDLKPANIGFRRVGRLSTAAPFDWEHAGRGPIAVDLWALKQGFLDAYRSHLPEAWQPSSLDLERVIAVGRLLRAIDAIRWAVSDIADRTNRQLPYWINRLDAAEELW